MHLSWAGMSRVMRSQTGRRIAVSVVSLCLIAGTVSCADRSRMSSVDQTTIVSASVARDSGDWVDFGPFLRRVQFGDRPDLIGPNEILVDGVGAVRIDASELLQGHIPGPFEVIEEFYSFTHDVDRAEPVLAGVTTILGPQSKRDAIPVLVPQTWVFGVEFSHLASDTSYVNGAPEAEVRVASRVLSGPEHRASLVGRSDLGVIAVQLQGTEELSEGVTERIVGVDVVRSTEVWFREHARAIYGDNTSSYFHFSDAATCSDLVSTFDVATGVVLTTRTQSEASSEWCR